MQKLEEISPSALSRESASKTAKWSPLLAVYRLGTVCAVTLLFYCLFWLQVRFAAQGHELTVAKRWTRRWFKALVRILGFQIESNIAHVPSNALLVPNHSGYVDDIALVSLVECFIVGKMEVTSWPVIGRLFCSTYQISVSRDDYRGLDEAVARVSERLLAGHTVCVFPEGTSTGNDCMLPFRSPMFEAALLARAPVVPVGIRWSATDPNIQIAEDVAYWKDHVFAKHAWRLLGLRGIRAKIVFGEPLDSKGKDRKTLARLAQQQIARITGLPIKGESKLPVTYSGTETQLHQEEGLS